MSITDDANKLWWKTYALACNSIARDDPKIDDYTLDQQAMEVADKTREEYIAEQKEHENV